MIDLEVLDGIAQLRLNRPDKLNSLNLEMIAALDDRCAELELREDVGVVILSGEGKAFCAGGDIDAWSTMPSDEFGRRWLREGHRVFDRLARLRFPVIAVLHGHTLGGGLELAACADLRIAEDHIKIGQPETGLGIITGWSGTQRAVRRFGAQTVRRMALMGEVLSAEKARHLGIVDHVVPRGDSMAAAESAAKTVLTRGPRATELTKMLINAAEGEEQERVIEAIGGMVAAASSDLQEGLAAYHARRPPNFWSNEETSE